ncbi:bifunctional ADP-dependent NAD(P)H-hydrate dehydratase/NAD(P)H-hydrate epimerase [Schaalia vaccimaxillae]|uniref:bifunctional ADP-dependent NAD(P)H-hydrate dehydratase/NAD(P)H-hydrate epimerase n=1 Tax=Schaalia vaccimaxillae TaxID=183916 RepID=UPI0003B31918|nr:bifunctional ADP-dependent NAD(P)H-hydrate dehydratase/NAD(P)H-hydrate epimerase [Schaalia vaccimaxillae]
MINVHFTTDIRQAECSHVEQARLEGDPDRLMRIAARAVCDEVLALVAQHEHDTSTGVCCLVGGGDNGGDALYAASFIRNEGVPACAILLSAKVHPRALAAARAAGVRILDASALLTSEQVEAGVATARDYCVWIDGILGSGVQGTVREPLASVIMHLEKIRRATSIRVVAIELPSGIIGEDGRLAGPVLGADVTVTMGGLKNSLVLAPAAAMSGKVTVVDLRFELTNPTMRLMTGHDAARCLLVPGALDHKYTRGVVGVVAGSQTYPGAGILACAGSAALGPGMIRLDAPARVQDLVLARDPGVVLVGGRIQTGLVGPGMDDSTQPSAVDLARFCLSSNLPVVIDAGALQLVPQVLTVHAAPTAILTPHAGEAAALLQSHGQSWTRQRVEDHPVQAAQEIASATGGIIVLKTAATVVAQDGQCPIIMPVGTPWTGVAGAGDVLAGMIAACAAQWQARREAPALEDARLLPPAGRGEDSLMEAVAGAVWIHGEAARVTSQRHGQYGAPIRAIQIADAAGPVIGGILGR